MLSVNAHGTIVPLFLLTDFLLLPPAGFNQLAAEAKGER